MKESIKKLIFLLSIMVSTNIFGEEVPNEIVRDNPKREVTTIESKKNRDRATMTLKITKLEPKKIKGELVNGVLTVVFPFNEKNQDIERLKLKVEAFPKSRSIDIPTEKKLKKYSIEDIRKELIQNRKREKSFTGVKDRDRYKIKVENVNRDEEIYISVLTGNKVIRAYKVDTTKKDIDIGTMTIDYDSRLGNKWIDRNKKVYDDFHIKDENEGMRYKELIRSNIDINDKIMATSGTVDGFQKVLSGEIATIDSVTYELYRGEGVSRELAAFPKIEGSFNTDTLSTNIYIHAGLSNKLRYKFKMEGDPNNYIYTIDKKRVEFEKTEVRAVLDLRERDLTFKNSGTWDITKRAEGVMVGEESGDTLALKIEKTGSKLFELASIMGNNVMSNYIIQYNGKNQNVNRSKEGILDLNGDGRSDLKIFLGQRGGKDVFKIDTLGGINRVSGESNLKIIAQIKAESKEKYFELATMDLKIITPEVYDIGEITFNIDKRFAEDVRGNNWISAEGVKDSIDSQNKIGYNNVMVEKIGSFNLELFKDIKVVDVTNIEERNYISTRSGVYKLFLKAPNSLEDEAAAPRTFGGIDITVSEYDKKMIISKNNSSFTSILDNRFTLLGKDSNNVISTIFGNAKENYVGNGVLYGDGTIDLTKVKGRFIFPNRATGTSMVGKSSVGQSVTLNFLSRERNNALDASGVIGSKKGKNIANLVKIEVQGEETETVILSGDNLETSFDDGNLKIGINTDEGDALTSGGLIIERNGYFTSKKVKISYYFTPDLTSSIDSKDAIKLGEFILEIKNDLEFELDGEGVLDFGKMIYDPNNLYHGASEIIKVKNPEGKDIEFSVEDTSVMFMRSEGTNTTKNKIDISGLKVEKIGDTLEEGKKKTSFRIEGFAEIKKETVPGVYKGEITVTVTLKRGKRQ